MACRKGGDNGGDNTFAIILVLFFAILVAANLYVDRHRPVDAKKCECK